MSIIIDHSHAEGTTLVGSRRGDGVWEIVRSLGWRYSRHVGIYVRGSRDRDANRPLIDATAEALRAAGHEVTVEINDTWRPAAVREAALAERADERADRYRERAAAAATWAGSARQRADTIATRFEFGQPILVGHHSEGRARRDQERIHESMRAAIAEGKKASRLADRADGVGRHLQHRHDSRTIMRRIERLEAELRRWRRGQVGNAREEARLTEELTYWRQVLQQRAETGEFVPWSAEHFQVGDEVLVLGSWLPVRRVNAKTVSVPGGYGMAGMDTRWSETVPWHKIHGRRRGGWQLDTPNGRPWPVELAVKVARWRGLLRRYAERDYSTDAAQLCARVDAARRRVLDLPDATPAAEVDAAWQRAEQDGVDAARALFAAAYDEYQRLRQEQQ